MRILYPPIRPNKTTMLAVGDGHELYVEECGNPQGLPALFLHGGPGGGCKESDRCFFNPDIYRIILFDQRGSGRSTPHASIADNSSGHLLADIEAVRTFLGIEQWLVFGGSWGSTLALLYAEAHPERVTGLILRGIFLCRERDIRWFYQSGANYLFPDYWRDFVSHIPEDQRDDIVAAYYRQLTSNNDIERMSSAKAWSLWEGRCSTLDPNHHQTEHFANPHFALALARIETHYFANHCFIDANQILDEIQRIQHLPGFIVHGRYDVVCPVEQAFALAQAWPKATLDIIRDAGHASSEPGITDALVRATDAMAGDLGAGA